MNWALRIYAHKLTTSNPLDVVNTKCFGQVVIDTTMKEKTTYATDRRCKPVIGSIKLDDQLARDGVNGQSADVIYTALGETNHNLWHGIKHHQAFYTLDIF